MSPPAVPADKAEASSASQGADQRGTMPAPAPRAEPEAPSTPAPEEWQVDWVSSRPELELLTRRLSRRCDVSIMRSSQLDAARLDDELTAMLREQLNRALALFSPGAVARLQPELTLMLDFLIFRFTIWEGQPLPGMSLMNLRYRNEAAVQPGLAAAVQPRPAAAAAGSGGSGGGGGSLQPTCIAGGRSGVEGPGLSAVQRSVYCLGAVLLRYSWARLTRHAAVQHWGDAAGSAWRQRSWVLLQRAESGYRLASLANFLVFLGSGRYRSLLDRLLRARLVYQQPSAARAISFEYLNRQLVWSELSELLLFLLPLLNVKAIKHALRSYLPRLPIIGASAAATMGMGFGGSGSGSGSAAGNQEQQAAAAACGICSTADILAPYAAEPCGHLFCYYCLRSHCLADPHYSCPLCLQRVDAMRRLHPSPGGGAGASSMEGRHTGGSGGTAGSGDDGGGGSSKRQGAAGSGAFYT